MILEEISYGVDDWNSDGLSFALTPQPYLPGTKLLIHTATEFGQTRGLAFQGAGHLSVLHPEAKVLETIALQVGSSTAHELADVTRPVDLAGSIDGTSLYVLDAGKTSVLRMNAGLVLDVWHLDLPISNEARMAIASEANSDLLFLGPLEDGRILCFEPGRSPRIIPLTIAISSSGQMMQIDPGSQFWPDFRNRTLFISDARNHRILEVDIASVIDLSKAPFEDSRSGPTLAEVVRIYGGRHGISENGQTIETLAFEYPLSVAVYRPEGFTLKQFLSSQSKKLVDEDKRRVFPRTILVGDTVSRRIQRLIEFGPGSTWPTRAYTLLGSGAAPQDQIQEIRTAPEHDMRQWAINAPQEMILSQSGQLCILVEGNFILVLTPTSALKDNIEYAQSSLYNWGIS